MRLRLLIILLAAALQFHMLTVDARFHPDEAFFMTFARNASVNGDWMLAGSLDKPPLSMYTSAVSMMFVGVTADDNGVLQLDSHMGEFAGRLPNVLYAILLVALMMRLAHALYQQRTVTLFAGLLTATSPYLLGFGATAFTDMSLLFWGTLTIWLTVTRRYGWAGVALGLAFWSKPQAVFFVPLVYAVYLYYRKEEACLFPTRMLSAVGVILLLCLWDNARPDNSVFILGTLNNSPDSLLASPAMYLPRLLEWGKFGAWLLGHPLMTLILSGVAIVGGIWTWVNRDRYRWIDALLWLYVVGYIGLHTVLALNQYDRYLLVILPLMVLLVAWGLSNLSRNLSPRYWSGTFSPNALGRGLGGGVVFISTLITLSASIPIGGDAGTYDGIDDLADYLNSKPVATVIYDRWLGWELGYYMGQWTNKRRVYYPTPAELVDGALALDEVGDRYLVAPDDKPVEAWLTALKNVGFGVDVDYQQNNFTVYRLSVPASDA